MGPAAAMPPGSFVRAFGFVLSVVPTGRPDIVESRQASVETRIQREGHRMIRAFLQAVLLSAFLVILQGGTSARLSAEGLSVISDKTVSDFKFPESVAYDPQTKALYVGEFGSELKPTEKDGQGRISKLSLDGKLLDRAFLPAAGQTLNKPKGLWIAGGRLWVADIDAVWEFDLASKEGKKLMLPGAQFANDATIIGDALYVSDNRGDQLYRIEPADFLKAMGEPKVTIVWSGKSINPNGIYPAADGSLLMVGFMSADEARGIYSMAAGGETKELAKGIGRLDGVYQMRDGGLLVTEWNTGSLAVWDEKMGIQQLASGFKGPADFAVAPNAEGLLVAVPDLVQSQVRLIQLGR
jgi:hypothetical protein